MFGLLVVLWQFVALEYLTVGEALSYWPLLPVFAGVSLVASRGRRRRVVARTRDGGFDVVAAVASAEREVTGRPSEGSVVAVLGDVELRVPEGWTVAVEVANVLGDVEDRRRRPGRGDHPDLVVDGVAPLGDVTVSDRAGHREPAHRPPPDAGWLSTLSRSVRTRRPRGSRSRPPHP